MDPWTISPMDRQRHDAQFSTLGPVAGFVTATTAGPFFMQSQLPQSTLSQIWTLADYNRDGRMDSTEFSIAMHLIQKHMQGHTLPPTLPPSMMPAIGGAVGMPSAFAAPTPMYAPQPMRPPARPVTTPTPHTPLTGSTAFDWSMDEHDRRKWAQLFNQIDKARLGKLPAARARNVMAESQLAHDVLAKVWTLADYDKDGQLTADEFCIAMHLMEVAKTGRNLPISLPSTLMSAAGRARSISTSLEDADVKMATNAFDTRRRENFDKGQAELDKRRQALLEEERLEREGRERKEREEYERRERERQAQERERQLEYEREMARQAELASIEHERQRRIYDQQQEQLRQRLLSQQTDWERQRVQELTQQRESVIEQVGQVKQQHKTMSFQLQAYDEKAMEINDSITSMRDKIHAATEDINVLKPLRDDKVKMMAFVQDEMKEVQHKLNETAAKRQQSLAEKRQVMAGSTMSGAYDRIQKTMQEKKENVARMKEEAKLAKVDAGSMQRKMKKALTLQASTKMTADGELTTNKELYDQLVALQLQAQTTIDQFQPEPVTPVVPAFAQEDGFGASFGASDSARSKADTSGQTARYRALFEFVASKEDELSFQPGDDIIVFMDAQTEPGWLAGQSRDKVGWFPETYAEPIDGPTAVASPTGGQQPVGAKLSSIPEHLNEHAEVVTAIYPFSAAEEGDLSFEVGDAITVLSKEGGDWWRGRVHDREGIFPASYVQSSNDVPAVEAVAPLEDLPVYDVPPGDGFGDSFTQPIAAPAEVEHHAEEGDPSADLEVGEIIAPFEATSENQLSVQPGDLVRLRVKSPSGWIEGELTRKGEGKKIGWFPGNYVKIIEQSAQPQGETLRAMYDYAAQHADELALKRGEVLTLVERRDEEWWIGKTDDGRQGLFPSNYVQPYNSDVDDSVSSSSYWVPPPLETNNDAEVKNDPKRQHCIEELLTTEHNYVDDLMMIEHVFRRPLKKVASPDEITTLFCNLTELTSLGQKLFTSLNRRRQAIGAVFVDFERPLNDAFVRFCQNQIAAGQLLDRRLAESKSSPFNETYAKCCSDARTEGLPLSHYLLLPMSRLTKYPLVISEMIKLTDENDDDHLNLTLALDQLRHMCHTVNQSVRAAESTHTLKWCQEHIINTATILNVANKMVFDSETNALGQRQYVHSGVLNKAKSSRQLVAILFNDMLLLTEPKHKKVDPSFTISTPTNITVTPYKQPLLLHHLRVLVDGTAEDTPNLKPDEARRLITLQYVVEWPYVNMHLLCPSPNARPLWTRQLQTAIDYARATTPVVFDERGPIRYVHLHGHGSTSRRGRLLIEVTTVKHLHTHIPPDIPYTTIRCHMRLGRQSEQIRQIEPHAGSSSDALCAAQFTLDAHDDMVLPANRHSRMFCVEVWVHLPYSKDILAGRCTLDMKEWLTTSNRHRGATICQLQLGESQLPPNAAPPAAVIIKYAVTFFGHM